MVYLACMIIGSMVPLVCACICTIDKDDSKDNNNNYCLMLTVSGSMIILLDKATGEAIEIYDYSRKEGVDFIYERRAEK